MKAGSLNNQVSEFYMKKLHSRMMKRKDSMTRVENSCCGDESPVASLACSTHHPTVEVSRSRHFLPVATAAVLQRLRSAAGGSGPALFGDFGAHRTVPNTGYRE